ncbi:phospholipase A [Dyadobacter sp. NIV53]|uniref:phospholipase A n=1 Tax=Dyadobacter sp. NIV53 TaxID=2861765 RepID=UPI001E5690DE|nr:phospholipase A [Dyadobacter sp. NIV53]
MLKIYTLTILSFCLIQSKAQTIADQSVRIKSISERWELADSTRRGTFLLTSYKPFYFSLGRWSSNPNRQPYSENPAYSVPAPTDYNHYEARFHISFKVKLLQKIFWGKGDLWAGYTQKAHWQIYNTGVSRPFRELNYEPELILNFPIRYKFLGFEGRTLGVAFNHQSNGRELPHSRSWNRIMFHTSMERKNWQITLRPWIRLKDTDDENPMILDYIGRGEVTVVYGRPKHQIYFVGTHPFTFGSINRGSAQLNWVFQIHGHLKGHAQMSAGYGETLIDYNHAQNTFGLGISFIDW